MLLKSIKLHNFRQFRDESVSFASGEDGKNVTIILGENGTGKTTFAQAFFWCMYGETEFTDQVVLNKIVASDMRPSQEESVLVELELKHGEVDYTLTREQKFKKEYSGKISSQNTKFDIARKNASGVTEYVKKTTCESEVKEILPEELSHYFFFDGERIDRMSKDIAAKKKSNDFAEAVKGLLGLNSMISAIQHFNPQSKYGVIGSYESSYDSKSNAKIQEYVQQIGQCNDVINKADQRIQELEDNIEAARIRKDEKEEELKQYEESRHFQERKEQLTREIDSSEKMKSQFIKDVCEKFNLQFNSFFSISLINRAMTFLDENDFSGKDIPDMHTKTIEYLLNQGECICGTSLQEGTLAYKKVRDLINFLPPQSISTTVGHFKEQSLALTKNGNNLKTSIESSIESISRCNDDIIDRQDEIRDIESKLSGGDVREKVRVINNEIQFCSKKISESEKEIEKNRINKGVATKERDRAETQRRELALLDEKNRKIEIYKAHAEKIYDDLNKEYTTSEQKVRKELEETINDIFKKIYDGGLSLSIDSNYHISVSVNDYDGYVETSSAQSVSVIFAFITAIIKMAREKRASEDENPQLLASEPYPLVMDAPLSTFDKKRIQSVCEVLPDVAEQVIIFIKDTDGELAENFMGDKIGGRHHFEKKNEFETTII